MKALETLEAKFRRMRRDYPRRKKAAESRVVQWVWATKPFWDIHDQEVPVTLTDATVVPCNEERLQEVIGSFLVAQLLSARDDGVFERLPRRKRCELGVEDPTTFAFGWPAYQDRGKDNRV